jgi:hypothetical protein
MFLDKRMLFIIGAPRSGTSWLQAMIGAHPSVCTTVELTLFSKYTAPWIKAWNNESDNIEQGRWVQGLPFLWTEGEFYNFLREFIAKVYERVADPNPNATHILDKHPGYSLYVKDIHKLLPDAQFIHLIRDGRDVVCSMMAARRDMGFGTAAVTESAKVWRQHIQAARDAHSCDGKYLEVRYEELLSSGKRVLKTVFEFCGLSVGDEELADIVWEHQFDRMKARRQSADERVLTSPSHYRKGKIGSWKEDLSPIQRYFFDEIAGDLLVELGYAEKGWWAFSRRQMIALPIFVAVSTNKYRRKRISRAIKAFLGIEGKLT